MTESLRTFIALDLCAEHKTILRNIQTRLKRADADVKWVESEHCHITLKFLGNTIESQIKPIADLMNGLAKDIASFPLVLGGLGAFPSIEQPDIIWAELAQGNQHLTDLSNALEDRLLAIGFSKEKRKFHPHITIGRTRSKHNAKIFCKALKTTPVISTAYKAQHITLFKSVLSPDGPQYSVLHRSPLKT